LFNAGYYWEAHEAWEGLWHAHGRLGPTANVLKGLIKLAAAGVKVRQGQPHGIITHARRAASLFEAARAEGGDRRLASTWAS
jgi:predicted metal-dependent hydrolase